MPTTGTLPITTVVDVIVSRSNPGIQVPQVNNLCILTTENPVNSVPDAGFFIYQNSTEVGDDWGTNSETFAQAVAVFAQRPNILSGGGQLVVYRMTGGITTLIEAVQAMEALFYVGAYVWAGYSPTNYEIEMAVAYVESLNKMIGAPSYLTADLTGSGLFSTLSGESVSAPIMFLYTQGGTQAAARLAMAAFMGRGMSTAFDGNATTGTMNLQQLATILGDSGITPSIQNTCEQLGVNIYPNIQSSPYVLSYGGPNANFFDTVYNSEWFANALTVAYFNALATTKTKVPQTEQGVQVVVSALVKVCQQAVVNGFLAPGTWNGEIPFGDPGVFDQNIEQNGYYVMSNPVATQDEASRAQRKNVIIQIAGKEAGAIQSGQVLVNLQA